MRRQCGICKREVIRAREIDGLLRSVDPDPVEDGGLVLVGDIDDQPLALWGVEEEGATMPWGTVIPAGAPRYAKHECTP